MCLGHERGSYKAFSQHKVGEVMDIADAWITGEREREERDREIGRAWLSLLIEGDPDAVGRVISELAQRRQISHLDATAKLQVSATMFMQRATAAALCRISGRGSDRECGCGCGETVPRP
jgi:hypothetical protein